MSFLLRTLLFVRLGSACLPAGEVTRYRCVLTRVSDLESARTVDAGVHLHPYFAESSSAVEA